MASSDLQQALDLMTGRWRSQILHAGVKLGVFDAIGSSTHGADQLAERLALDPINTYRLLRALASIGLIHVVNWRDYIDLQESLTLAFNQLIYRVDLSHFVLSVSYDTTDQQLAAIPALVQGIIDRTPGFQLKACRLLVIGEFSYDFKCHLFSEGLSFIQFKDSIDWINRELLRELAVAEIVIPFPTAIEIKG